MWPSSLGTRRAWHTLDFKDAPTPEVAGSLISFYLGDKLK